MSGRSRTVVCTYNVEIADFLCAKREESRAEGKWKLVKTMDTAVNGLCDHPTPITNLREAKKVRGIGTQFLKLLAPFFYGTCPTTDPFGSQESAGVQGKTKRRYCPRKRTAAYALLITLLKSGKSFMMKQELIDETEKSGLSDKPIRPNGISFTSGKRDPEGWHSGWSGMKTLIEKGLVIKFSNPAKYKLTDEGKSVTQECIDQSGFSQESIPGYEVATQEELRISPARQESGQSSSERQGSPSSDDDEDNEIQKICRSDFRQRNNIHFSSSQTAMEPDNLNCSFSRRDPAESASRPSPPIAIGTENAVRAGGRFPPRNSWTQYPVPARNGQGTSAPEIGYADPELELAVPPLNAGENFSDVYEVICLIDKRERFRSGTSLTQSLLGKFSEGLQLQFKVKVEARTLPLGDALWIAHHKQQKEDYVLDFVVERKNVSDLWGSIKDGRYKKQKLRLMTCGLSCLLYLVEGDVNTIVEGSTESLKTAMFTTELQDTFRILRTADPTDTCRQYGHLTRAIMSRYNSEVGKVEKSGRVCKSYNAFAEHCKDLQKNRVRDIFCLQLTQISRITEMIALSIQDRYPTIILLVEAYTDLEGDHIAQEKLLEGLPIRNTSKTISAVMSKSVYKAMWAT